MISKAFVLFCLQALLLKGALGMPKVLSLPNSVNQIQPPTSVVSGTVSQTVAPSFTPNWPASAQPVPLVTEIVPNLEFGEITVDGDMPVGGMIKISGTFPVFGNIAVDGSVPSYGSGYVDAANVFPKDCSC